LLLMPLGHVARLELERFGNVGRHTTRRQIIIDDLCLPLVERSIDLHVRHARNFFA
jgi:hypothetical protein